MRVSLVTVLSAALLLCLASVATARPRCETALRHVEAIIDVYSKEYPSKLYPGTLKELQTFAAKKGTSLNLALFSEFTYKRSGKRYTILYTCRDTGLGGALGGARITVH